MKHKLFCYGTLEYASVINDVIGRIPEKKQAWLKNHQRYAIKDKEYPGLRQQMGSETIGTNYFNISDSELSLLDIYEGDQYERVSVMINLKNGEMIASNVYLTKFEYHNLLVDSDWNPSQFANCHLSNYMKE